MEVALKSILLKYFHTTAHRKSTTWLFSMNPQLTMSNLKENVSKMLNKIHTFQVIQNLTSFRWMKVYLVHSFL